MKIHYLLTAVAATALIGGAAYAQQPTTTTTTTTTAPSPPATSDTAAPAAPTGAAVQTSVTAVDASSGATLTDTLVTNGPIPDTPANRAKYGQPMSQAGKHTPARGN